MTARLAAILLALPLALTFGCKKNEDAAESSGEAAEEVSFGSQVPADEASQAFARKLVAMDLAGYRPTNEVSVVLTYKSFTFAPGGRFEASAEMKVDEELISCTEAGTWTMDAASSESVATMTWTLEKTTCGGREPGDTRVEVNLLDDGQFKVQVR